MIKIVLKWAAAIAALLALTAFGYHFLRFTFRGFSCVEGIYAIISLINVYGFAAVTLLIGRR